MCVCVCARVSRMCVVCVCDVGVLVKKLNENVNVIKEEI